MRRSTSTDAAAQGGDRRVIRRLPAAHHRDLAGPGWGWHMETGVHVMRMALGGCFDRFPKLNLLIGHLGEGLIYVMQRVDFSLAPATTKLKQPVSHYLRNNIYYTFSGFNFAPAFLAMLLELGGVDRTCSRPTIRISRWRRRARSWSRSR